ncbi:MAG: xylulokinase [Clostridiales bacterium]|nr:xylulokinase [Clostridiales bacterium]
MLLGIDVGTSSIKAMLMEEEGRVIGVKTKGYDVNIPREGWAEQNPEEWWEALCRILGELKSEHFREFEAIRGIGFSGQMHGLIAVDQEGKTVRPAIIWMDQRAGEELKEIGRKIYSEEQGKIFHNRIFNGFALPSLLWMKNHEPENFQKTYKVFQPKDYLRFRLTGEMGTEFSDASASLMMDVGKREWAKESLERLGISGELLPKLGESVQVAGYVTEKGAKETGLKKGIPVVFGAGDQQAQSIGNGAVREGLMISNIGTGAQVSAYSREDRYDHKLRTHTFCHGIPGGYTIYGAMLSGGMSLKWLKNQILLEESFAGMSAMAEETEAGSRGLVFLPYLAGERTPHMNPAARGVFFGLSLEHTRAHMVRAVMEGVTYALRDSMEILDGMGVKGEKILASGGACSSEIWLQIQADILGKEVQVCKMREQACLGACILAGVGVGSYGSIEEACEKLVRFEEKVYVPRREVREVYEENYRKFQGIYEGTKAFL